MLDFEPTRDTERLVESGFSRQTVDALMYYLFEANLSDEQKEEVKRVFLGRKRNPINFFQSNSSLVDEDFIASYAMYRSQGLSQRDAATLLGITVHRLESLLYGDDLMPLQHKRLLHAESVADAHIKSKCLRTLDDSIADGNWKAAITLLEKKFPAEYGRKLEVNSTANVRWSADECAQAAKKAASDLERIRAERAEMHGVPQEELYVEAAEPIA